MVLEQKRPTRTGSAPKLPRRLVRTGGAVANGNHAAIWNVAAICRLRADAMARRTARGTQLKMEDATAEARLGCKLGTVIEAKAAEFDGCTWSDRSTSRSEALARVGGGMYT